MPEKISAGSIRQKKGQQKISALTAYDAPTAAMLDKAGVDMILVGDSVGNVLLGYENTIPVTMEQMLHHVSAVCRGAERALVVADMPFMSFGVDTASSVLNAGRFLKEGGAGAVKIEGGLHVVETVRYLVQIGIPVLGHIGLTPQAINQLGSYRPRGRDRAEAASLLEAAVALEAAGVFALVLECIPRQLSALITERLTVPTIGIGAGEACDGQILVTHDLLGLYAGTSPRFARRYADLNPIIDKALRRFVGDVQSVSFPALSESYEMPEEELEGLR